MATPLSVNISSDLYRYTRNIRVNPIGECRISLYDAGYRWTPLEADLVFGGVVPKFSVMTSALSVCSHASGYALLDYNVIGRERRRGLRRPMRASCGRKAHAGRRYITALITSGYGPNRRPILVLRWNRLRRLLQIAYAPEDIELELYAGPDVEYTPISMDELLEPL